MTSEPRHIEFTAERPDDVVVVMAEMSNAHSGWINFQPAVDPDDVPPPEGGILGLFTSRGPEVPLGTWTPASAPRRGRSDPPMIGLQHAAGTRAKARLDDVGHPVPEGWVIVQDYAKKGLVVAVPPAVPHAEVVEWLLGAGAALSNIPITGVWRAAVYDG